MIDPELISLAGRVYDEMVEIWSSSGLLRMKSMTSNNNRQNWNNGKNQEARDKIKASKKHYYPGQWPHAPTLTASFSVCP